MIKKLMMLLMPLLCITAMAGVPQVTMFYPGESTPPQYSKADAAKYIYFEAGSKVTSATAQIIQAGEILGTATYSANKPTTALTMKYTDPGNEALAKIAQGDYTLSVYEVVYEEDGSTQTYSDVNNPIATITYTCPAPPATLESETYVSAIRSYYSTDEEDGVIEYTFTKALNPTNITVAFEYGYGDSMYRTELSWSMANDNKTVVVDLHGHQYDSNTLAHGHQFYDIDGSLLPMPTSVVLVVENLIGDDGTAIETISTSLDGMFSTTVSGKVHRIYHYNDTGFATPVLAEALFYSSSNPTDTHTYLAPGCNMMDLKVKNAEVIEQTDVTFTCGSTTATVAWAEVTAMSGGFTVAVPEEVLNADNDEMQISLTNYSFKFSDGMSHIIKPLELKNQTKEVNTIAAVKLLNENETVILNVASGLLVTFANDMGFCFMEDATGALNITTDDYSQPFAQGTLVSGKIVGKYVGGGTFMVIPNLSEYSVETADVSRGLEVSSLENVVSEENNYRLLTFVANDDLEIVFDGENYVIGNKIFAITEYIENFQAPEGRLVDITGILFNDPSLDTPLLIVRSLDDIKFVPFTSISTTTQDRAAGAVYSIDGIKAGKNSKSGLYIIDGQKKAVKNK